MLFGSMVLLCHRTSGHIAWNSSCNQKQKTQSRNKDHKSAVDRSTSCLLPLRPIIHRYLRVCYSWMPLLERKVNVVWSKLCYPFDDRWILFQKTLKRRKKRKCVSTTKDVVTHFILQLSRDFQSRIASCPDCQRVEVTDVVFKYRKKKTVVERV